MERGCARFWLVTDQLPEVEMEEPLTLKSKTGVGICPVLFIV